VPRESLRLALTQGSLECQFRISIINRDILLFDLTQQLVDQLDQQQQAKEQQVKGTSKRAL